MSDNEYPFSLSYTCFNRGEAQPKVVVEEEKSDNIHDAVRIVLKKSNANDGKDLILQYIFLIGIHWCFWVLSICRVGEGT